MTNIKDVAGYILRDASDSGQRVRHMKLQKLCYYAQGYHLAITGSPLFPEEFEAWQYGPVAPELEQEFGVFGHAPIPPPTNSPALTEFEQMLLDLVIARFEWYNDFDLSRLTHREDPWRNARGRKAEVGASIITKGAIHEWFAPRLHTLSIKEPPPPPTPAELDDLLAFAKYLLEQ